MAEAPGLLDSYTRNLHALFVQRGCVGCGYTKYAIELMKTCRTYIVKGRQHVL